MTADGAFGTGAESNNGYNPTNPISTDFYAPNDARAVWGFNKGKPQTRFGIKSSKNRKRRRK